jgi:ribosomal protein S18 acetylase RimI-like enzyme
VSACTVRSFRTSDRDALVSLWASVFPNDPPRNEPGAMIDNKMRVQPELLLVAEEEGRIVGAVIAGFDGTRGWVYHVAVDPAHRRRGVGTALVEAAVEGLRALGCPKVNLQIRMENRGVVDFYRTLSFEVEEHVQMGRLLTDRAAVGENRP